MTIPLVYIDHLITNLHRNYVNTVTTSHVMLNIQ